MRRNGVRVTIRGISYPSLASAARALGVDVGTVWQAKKRGTLDYIGTTPIKTSSIIARLAKAKPEDIPYLQLEAQKWIDRRNRK